jgi:hypothetical protein
VAVELADLVAVAEMVVSEVLTARTVVAAVVKEINSFLPSF